MCNCSLIWILLIIAIITIVVVALYSGRNVFKAIYGSSEAVQFKKLRIDDEFINEIRDGKKTIDARKSNPVTREIKKGDYVHFFSGRNGQDAIVQITAVNEYENLDALLNKETFSKMFPSADSKDKKIMFIKADQGGKGYYTKEELTEPMYAFHFKIMFPSADEKK